MSLRTVWNDSLEVRVFLNVVQLLKQRWLEGLQTVGSLSKYNGDKETMNNNMFKLAKLQLNLHVHYAFLSVAVVTRLRLEMFHVLLGKWTADHNFLFFCFFFLF